MFLYILAITILFYSLLLYYYKLIFSSFHITSFLLHTNLYFHFLIFFCHILNNPYLKTYTFHSPPHRHAEKTANKLLSQLHCFKNYPVFLFNTISLFSVFFSITNRGDVASIFFYIYFTKLWLSLSLSLSLTASTVSSFISFVCSFLFSFYFFILSFDIY